MMTPLRVRNMDDKLKAIIYHIIERLGLVDGRTRLMKLIYLADLEAAKKLRHPISGARFYSYIHGPFAKEVLHTIDELKGFWIDERVTRNAYGDRSYIYTLSDFPFAEPLMVDNPEEESILNEVIEKWGRQDLNTILRHVYNTEPFKSTPSCEYIDLSKVKPAKGHMHRV